MTDNQLITAQRHRMPHQPCLGRQLNLPHQNPVRTPLLDQPRSVTGHQNAGWLSVAGQGQRETGRLIGHAPRDRIIVVVVIIIRSSIHILILMVARVQRQGMHQVVVPVRDIQTLSIRARRQPVHLTPYN